MTDEEKKTYPKTLLIAWILSVLAILNSIWLLVIHLQGEVGSLCNIATGVSCNVLGIKRYSEWMGVPVPIFSILFYGVTSAFLCQALRSKGALRTRPLVYAFWLSLWSVCVSIYFAYISFFVLRTICPFCFLLYLLSIGMAVFAFLEYRKIQESWTHLIRYDLKTFHRKKEVWIGLLLSVLFIGGSFFLPSDSSKGTLDVNITQLAPVEARTLGAKSAQIAIDEFSDFRCPYCRIAGEVMKKLEKELRGKVKIIYRFFPLDASCNPLGGSHKTSCEAAYAAYCAGVQGRFWVVHDLIYMAQGSLTESVIYQIASQAGLDLGQFDECIASPETKAMVLEDIEAGNRLGLNGTPSIFINGRRYQGGLTVEALKDVILKELQ